MSGDLAARIDALWECRDQVSPALAGPDRAAIEEVWDALDRGALRVAEPACAGWVVHGWIKRALLLGFRLYAMRPIAGGWDKIALKFADWSEEDFAASGIRVVPGAVVRRSAYVAPGCVLMPCFVNAGAHIGAGTMIDTWATVGSAAQVGARCHVSGGAGIGGVLEPVQAAPVIIEDECFIGARSEVAEGVHIERGAVLGMGVFLSASTKIVDRATGEIVTGRVPAYAVVVPGTLPSETGPALACAVIVKRVDARTRAKTAINELLRGA